MSIKSTLMNFCEGHPNFLARIPVFSSSYSVGMVDYFLHLYNYFYCNWAGKILGCGLGAYLYGQSFWESTIIGSGMNGRGAVEMVIAAVVIKSQ